MNQWQQQPCCHIWGPNSKAEGKLTPDSWLLDLSPARTELWDEVYGTIVGYGGGSVTREERTKCRCA